MPDAPILEEFTPELMIDRARGLVPLIRKQAFEAKKNRNVSEEIIEKRRDQNLFKILQPKHFSGREYEITTVVHRCLECSSSGTTTAWVGGLGIVRPWLDALFLIKYREEIWGNNTDAHCPN